MSEQQTRKPDAVLRSGKIAVAVWTKLQQDGDREYETHSLLLRKVFKEKDGQDWREFKIPLFVDELPALAALLMQAYMQFGVKREYPTRQGGR